MSFQFVQDFIVVFCAAGILVIFLRRIPEVVEDKGQLRLGASNEVKNLNRKTFGQRLSEILKSIFSGAVKKVWHFALEAKDLKQGQILAAKFSKRVFPTKKVINIGVHSQLKKAEQLTAEGQAEAAEQELFQILKKHPHEYAAYEALVNIYLKDKRNDEILEIMEYLVKHNPKNDYYLVQLGNILMTKRRYEEAISAYQSSIEINDLVSVRFVNVGLCYQALAQYPNARKFFQKALDLEPTNVQYLMMLVEVLLKLDERTEAHKKLEQGAEMDPDKVLIKEKLMELVEKQV